jgi:uncharacterized protein YndB with AHSA1/START domain
VTVSVELETTIARPPEDVFAELIAIERYPTWLVASGIVAVERLDAGPASAGSRVRISQQVAGRSTTLEGSISTLEPGRAIGLRGRDPDGISIEIDATLAGADATTRLRWSLRIGLPLRYRMFESMVAPQVRRAATLDLEALRRRLEAPAG